MVYKHVCVCVCVCVCAHLCVCVCVCVCMCECMGPWVASSCPCTGTYLTLITLHTLIILYVKLITLILAGSLFLTRYNICTTGWILF